MYELVIPHFKQIGGSILPESWGVHPCCKKQINAQSQFTTEFKGLKESIKTVWWYWNMNT